MVMEDINSARPRYLSWTLFRDYHYAVFDARGELALILVVNKGEHKGYLTKTISSNQNVVYENHFSDAVKALGLYARNTTDLINSLKQYNYPTGEYQMCVVDASGNRLYTFSIWI